LEQVLGERVLAWNGADGAPVRAGGNYRKKQGGLRVWRRIL
jgi:hypothetical protein